jgi:hypothetical protein
MKFLRNHWYDAGLIPMTAAVVCLIASWSEAGRCCSAWR